jgi:hypothetical protein
LLQLPRVCLRSIERGEQQEQEEEVGASTRDFHGVLEDLNERGKLGLFFFLEDMTRGAVVVEQILWW